MKQFHIYRFCAYFCSQSWTTAEKRLFTVFSSSSSAAQTSLIFFNSLVKNMHNIYPNRTQNMYTTSQDMCLVVIILKWIYEYKGTISTFHSVFIICHIHNHLILLRFLTSCKRIILHKKDKEIFLGTSNIPKLTWAFMKSINFW